MSSLPPGYTSRTPSSEDAEAIAALVNRCSVAEAGVPVVGADQLRNLWQIPTHRIDADDWLVDAPDGSLAGAAVIVAIEPFNEITTVGVVAPEHLGRGIGTWLAERVEARAREYAELAPPGEAVVLHSQTWSGAEQAACLLAARGHQLVRTFRLMQIDFTPGEEVPAPVPPPGIEIRTFVPGRDEELAWRAHEESFADHWNHHPSDLETFIQQNIDADGAFDPSIWWLALDGDEVAGVACCTASAPGEPDLGWVSSLGVRRPWRGRGVARALLETAFHEFQRRGRSGVRLGVDAQSPTGADRLYVRAGMHAVADGVVYALELRSAIA